MRSGKEVWYLVVPGRPRGNGQDTRPLWSVSIDSVAIPNGVNKG